MGSSQVSRDDVAELMRTVVEPVRARMAPTGARVWLGDAGGPMVRGGEAWPLTAEIEAVLR
ncbi:MAG: hypothetical protein RI958_2871, partial [Actinomycetota bacterium]